MGILQQIERSVITAMCGIQLKERAKNLMLMLGLNETMEMLAMANIALALSCVEEGRWSCFQNSRVLD